ncbi:MAG TPA: alpha-ketoglutarate-dependent dioxygenase AlkB [Kofleriaceae bacterium]|nr:alpha-ketoglutarate-dependent dioxygenase AlkB [Kofleriaceae bacterium]
MTRFPPTSRARMGTSRLGGVAAALEPPGAPVGQLALPIAVAPPARGDRPGPDRREPLPAVVHIAGWLTAAEQRALVAQFAEWALPPAGLRHPRVPSGHLMSVQSVCLGWHWQPYAYSRTADDTDGAPVKPLPIAMADLARRAVADAYGPGGAEATRYAPDAAIVNRYPPGAHLGLHRDGEEPSDAPVVTISLGDRCVFRLAGVDRRTAPFTDIDMGSGDLLVFGGPNRRIYHGVPRVMSGTSPDGLGLPPGRLSITVRETGLDG